MSIIIKGMEMPDSCFHCKLAEVCQHYKAEHYANKRHEDCPLEEVPSAQPEAQLSEESTTSDCISRQAAIDELKEKRDSAKEWYEEASASGDEMMLARAESSMITFVECLLTIKNLPSAQPETHDKRTETHACDLIDRQAAIDYCYALINAENPSDPSDEWNYSQERINQTEVILHHLEFMPSAQPELPELIMCKDCEYGKQDEYGRWYCRSLGCQIGNEDGSGFCADAERRPDVTLN